jgi:hypothetical protein
VSIGNYHLLYEEIRGQAFEAGDSLTVNPTRSRCNRAKAAEIAVPSSYFTMWGMLIIMALGAVAGPLVHGNVLGSIRAAYPADVAKRDALHRCAAMDSDFSRFSEHDRDVCYHAMLHTGGQAWSATAAGM